MINIRKAIMQEEDIFPKVFTNYRIEPYGILFYNELNKTSYDSNHAVIYRNEVLNLGEVLDQITAFYQSKDIHPSIYQAVIDEGYFQEEKDIFRAKGYNTWVEEPANFMLLNNSNKIFVQKTIDVRLVTEWDKRIATDICIPSNEEYEIEVFKQSVKDDDSKVFVGYVGNKAVAITRLHLSEYDCCRFDYILVSKNDRKNGYARELLSYVTDYCRDKGIKNCYQWPAHKTSEKLCHEAGFRSLFKSEIARASYSK